MAPFLQRKKNRYGAAVVLLAAAGAAAYLLTPSPPPSPLIDEVEREHAAAETAAETAAASAEAPAEASPERGYLRRLKVIEPPLPGQAPREVRNAAVVGEETAVALPGAAPLKGVGSGSFSLAAAGDGGFPASASVGAPGTPGGFSGGARAAGGGGPERAGAPNGRGSGGPPPADADADADGGALFSASSEASRLVKSARNPLKNDFLAGVPYTPKAIAAALRKALAKNREVDDSVRGALDALGPDASPQAREEAAAAVLDAAGEPSSPEDVQQALAKASAPPSAPPSPAAVDDAIRQFTSNLPSRKVLDQTADEIALTMKAPPAPNAPPPKGGVDAYVQYRDAFDRVEKEDGLKPSQVVPFPAIESSLGRNTGKKPLETTLMSIRDGAQFKASQRIQAGRDIVATTDLIAKGDLGGRKWNQLYGSYMGAIGITQFLPTSWAAYGRSMSGGPRDPWNFRDAVLSTGNYLEKHGSRRDYNHAILTYNYSAKYQHDILQYGANVAPGIEAVKKELPKP